MLLIEPEVLQAQTNRVFLFNREEDGVSDRDSLLAGSTCIEPKCTASWRNVETELQLLKRCFGVLCITPSGKIRGR
jgi:hypothetical protein